LAAKYGFDQDGGSLAGEDYSEPSLESQSSASSVKQRSKISRISTEYDNRTIPARTVEAIRPKPNIPKKHQLTTIEVFLSSLIPQLQINVFESVSWYLMITSFFRKIFSLNVIFFIFRRKIVCFYAMSLISSMCSTTVHAN
jgi:hypothetical protein